MGGTNFTECGNTYMSDPSLIERYNYSGRVRLIPPNPLTQITYEGCKALCGTGNEYYPWSAISATLTTWILPILGTLLQAPFESNAFWRTVKAINRWIGSPISSLAFILWDIEISGKCSLFGTSACCTKSGFIKADRKHLTWLFPMTTQYLTRIASLQVCGTRFTY